MKIPFYTVLGPLLRRNSKTFKRLCSYSLLSTTSIYAILLGILGAGLSLVDMIRIIQNGSELPCSLWRSRISGKLVAPETERDLKLMSLVLAFEYYLLLIFGTITRNSVLYLPWLILYAIIITLEFLNLICRFFLDGFHIKKNSLIISMFIIYNWLAIFCAFFRITGGCDI